MTFTMTLPQLLGIIAGLASLFGAIAGAVVWAYSTFVTRTEAAKLEEAVDKLLLGLKTLFDEKFKVIHKRIDELVRRRSEPRPKKYRRSERRS